MYESTLYTGMLTTMWSIELVLFLHLYPIKMFVSRDNDSKRCKRQRRYMRREHMNRNPIEMSVIPVSIEMVPINLYLSFDRSITSCAEIWTAFFFFFFFFFKFLSPYGFLECSIFLFPWDVKKKKNSCKGRFLSHESQE
jgi:hypothetical protein